MFKNQNYEKQDQMSIDAIECGNFQKLLRNHWQPLGLQNRHEPNF